MDKESANQLARLVAALYGEIRLKPFPYLGVRKLLRRYPGMYETLIADLDWFDSTVAGYSSRVSSVPHWAYPETQEAISLLSRSFYDKHPEYLPLQTILTDFPDLCEDIETHEKMRQSLLLLFAFRLHQPDQS